MHGFPKQSSSPILTRPADWAFTKPLLYQLSYVGRMVSLSKSLAFGGAQWCTGHSHARGA